MIGRAPIVGAVDRRRRSGEDVRFRLFGGVAADGVELGGPKQRAVLAVLLLEPGRVVSLDRIVESVWGDAVPDRPEASVRGYVSNLRAALDGVATLAWRDGGYVCAVDVDDVDIHRFERLVELVAASVRDGLLLDAADAVAAATALWRGRPFGSLADAARFAPTVTRLDERAAHLEELATDVRLARGEAAELVAGLTDAVTARPFRERRRAQLALALYRAGRPVDALRSIEAARSVLRDEVGVDPGPELVRLQHAILGHDPSLLWRPPATDSATGQVAPFVGRRSELDRLAAAAAAVGTRGGIVVLSGEAGIGKTALVRAACDRLAPWPAVWARCVEATVDTPYGAWSTIASQLTHLGLTGPTDLAAVDDPVASRGVLAESLHQAREPFCVVVDDLQWADAATLGLIEALAYRPPAALLLVVTVRAGELRPPVEACLAELSRTAARIDLGGLGLRDVEEWIAVRQPHTELARRVHDRTGGHPFFIREVVALIGVDDDAAVALDGVPAAIHDVVRRRVAQLGPRTQQLLAAAAVLGRRVDLGVLAGVVDEPIDIVLDTLDPAVAAGLLEADAERIGQLQFAHAIVAEALRAEQTPARLARAHAAVSRVIEARWAGDLDTVIDALAVHAHAGAAAGTAASAVVYGTRAAERAMAANAPGEAAAHLTRVLDALAVDAPADRTARQRLLTALGTAQAAAGDAMAARRSLVRAAALADARGDVAGVVAALRFVNGDDLWSGLDWAESDEATIELVRRTLERLPAGPTTDRVELTAALSTELYATDPDAALRAAGEAAAIAVEISDPLVEARALLRLCWAAWRPSGQPTRAAAGDRLLALVATGTLPARFRPLAHLTRFVAAYEVGDGQVADRQLTLARASADPLRTPAEWTYLLYAEWSLLVARGRFAEAADLTDQVREAMRRSRPAVADVTWVGLTVQLATEQGRTEAALAALDRLASTPYAATSHWWRAWTLARAGHLPDARAHLHAFDGPLTDDWYRAPLLSAAVEAAVLADDTDFTATHVDALRPLQDYIAIAGSGGLVLGPIALTVARADLHLGDIVGARRALARAQRIASTTGSETWLAAIDMLRRQL